VFATDDTIVAIATPAGRGGVGVVRLSGPRATAIAMVLTGRAGFEPRHATFARLSAGGHVVDHAVITAFPAPHSYTGDEVVEISAHGSPVLLEQIVALALDAGSRLAEPGEFTLRAYLNGRIDLVQAEAVADLVDAVTPAQARAAMDQLDGTLTTDIATVHEGVFALIARCEASLDFPEEGFHFASRDELAAALVDQEAALTRLLASAPRGRLLRDGLTVAFAGRPNTGKSSLFNALLGRGRAIVSERPGTTRDVLTERMDLDGVPVTLIDTAGVRASTDPIEVEGVRRAEDAHAAATCVVVVLDGATPLTADDTGILAATAARPRIVVRNKADLGAAWSSVAGVGSPLEVSAATGDGLDVLRRAILDQATGEAWSMDTPAITNQRHIRLIEAARDAIVRAAGALSAGATEELVLVDLHEARARLEEVTGRRTIDDLLRHIFSTFCIGK
jgi:tRNA modification GTPase